MSHVGFLLAGCLNAPVQRLLTFLLLFSLCANAEDFVGRITPLIDPVKLSTLGLRGANPRVQKYTYWLAEAHRAGENVTNICSAAVQKAGYTNQAAAGLTVDAMLRNLDIASKLGCLDKSGLADMRRGRSPTIRKGPYAGDELSVDHIIPRAVVLELDNVIANLELLPMRMNSGKGKVVTDRQRNLAKKFHAAGLLSADGLRAPAVATCSEIITHILAIILLPLGACKRRICRRKARFLAG